MFAKLSARLFQIKALTKLKKSVSIPNKTESIEFLLVSNLVIHSSKFRSMVNSVFSISNSFLTKYSIHPLKSTNLSGIPSILLFIIETIRLLPSEESSMFFTRHFKSLFEFPIVSELSIDFLASNFARKLPNKKRFSEFFDGNVISQMAMMLFDTKSPHFKKAGERSLIQTLFTLMKGQFKNQLLQFKPIIEKLPVCGHSLPFAIDIVTSYFSTVAWNIYRIPLTEAQKEMQQKKLISQSQKKGGKEKPLTEEEARQNLINFQKGFGIKEIGVIQSIFQVCPSILNALKLGKTLITASSFFDSLALIFGKLAPFEDGSFLGVVCIASMYYFEFANDDEKKKRFNELVSKFEEQNSTFKSRSRALKLISDDSGQFVLEKAFAVACLETNDDGKIEEVINLF